VYVFLVNGFDPLGWGGAADARTALIRAGFRKVYDGQFYHAGWFADEMRRLHAEEPDVRIAVVGFGAGVEVAAWLAGEVAADGVVIDLLASVDAPFWSDAPGRHPENVGEVIAVEGRQQGPLMPEFELANDPPTLDWLATELALVAGAVPAPPIQPKPPASVAEPTPRPFTARPRATRDEWDFLKPVAQLREILPAPAHPVAEQPPDGERTALR
jgi:hypothetical protein